MVQRALGAGGTKNLFRKLLVVDDEHHIARLMQVNLQRAGYTVITALDGEEAISKASEEEFDLVIIDAVMPNMDGYVLTERLRSESTARHIPIMLLIQNEKDAEKALQCGADYYTVLFRPFNPMELRNLIPRN